MNSATGKRRRLRRAATTLPDVQATEDFDRLLDEFFAANPEKLPALPADFSRADIYSDHD
jgi:alpha-galactosidase/6-phospho-beta-glucosidase family protein